MKITATWAVSVAVLALSAAACGGGSDSANDEVESAESVAADVVEEIDDSAANLADVLAQNGLTSIASALEAVDLAELTDTPEYTFLAPSDEAFQSVDPDELAALLSDPGAVKALLRNHMLTERLTASDVSEMSSVETAAGNTLTVSADGGTVMLDDATVTAADIEAGDGMVHVVDRLLLP